jgi:hypothetical protein
LVDQPYFGRSSQNGPDPAPSSVVISQPARPAALGCVGLIKKPDCLGKHELLESTNYSQLNLRANDV